MMGVRHFSARESLHLPKKTPAEILVLEMRLEMQQEDVGPHQPHLVVQREYEELLRIWH